MRVSLPYFPGQSTLFEFQTLLFRLDSDRVGKVTNSLDILLTEQSPTPDILPFDILDSMVFDPSEPGGTTDPDALERFFGTVILLTVDRNGHDFLTLSRDRSLSQLKSFTTHLGRDRIIWQLNCLKTSQPVSISLNIVQ